MQCFEAGVKDLTIWDDLFSGWYIKERRINNGSICLREDIVCLEFYKNCPGSCMANTDVGKR